MQNKKNIVITGGNRGIGFGLLKIFSKNHNVIVTVRTKKNGSKAIADLKKNGNELHYVVMDLEDSNSITSASEIINEKFESVDILINNAGIFIKDYEVPAIETNLESILHTFNTNTLGTLRVCRALVPLMKKSGRIINISSGMGQLDEMESGSTAYRLSKTALNALSKILSNELSNFRISVNTICPGWVKTDMGGPNATLTVEESATKIVEFSLIKDFPNGQFLRHGKVIPW